MDDPNKTTPKELECLEAIETFNRTIGRYPSVAEIGAQMGIGKAGAQRHMESLKRKGKLRGPRIVGGWEVTSTGRKELPKKKKQEA